jgi:hypothetical protein
MTRALAILLLLAVPARADEPCPRVPGGRLCTEQDFRDLLDDGSHVEAELATVRLDLVQRTEERDAARQARAAVEAVPCPPAATPWLYVAGGAAGGVVLTVVTIVLAVKVVEAAR